MKGLIALVGAGEYLPVMDEVDRHLLASVNTDGRAPQVVCLPTAAGQEGDESVGRWLKMGEEHFKALGAQVHPLPIIDRASADDPQFEPILESADLIYFSGGNPLYLYETMNGSRGLGSGAKSLGARRSLRGMLSRRDDTCQTSPQLPADGHGNGGWFRHHACRLRDAAF